MNENETFSLLLTCAFPVYFCYLSSGERLPVGKSSAEPDDASRRSHDADSITIVCRGTHCFVILFGPQTDTGRRWSTVVQLER